MPTPPRCQKLGNIAIAIPFFIPVFFPHLKALHFTKVICTQHNGLLVLDACTIPTVEQTTVIILLWVVFHLFTLLEHFYGPCSIWWLASKFLWSLMQSWAGAPNQGWSLVLFVLFCDLLRVYWVMNPITAFFSDCCLSGDFLWIIVYFCYNVCLIPPTDVTLTWTSFLMWGMREYFQL